MKRLTAILSLSFVVGSWTNGFADFPIRQSTQSDGLPVVAYNSIDHEYLVVWVEVVPSGSFYTYSVMGQRLSDEGAALGDAFVILQNGVNPSVVHNAMHNEYLVVANPGGGYVGQRVSNTGTLIKGTILSNPFGIMSGVTGGRLLYNSLRGGYLFLGAALEENPPASGYYNIKVYSYQFAVDGIPLGSLLLVEDQAHGYMPAEPSFGAAYAPVQTAETPYGRYLLAVGRGLTITMLNSDGEPMDVVYDPAHPDIRSRHVPFTPGSPAGGEFHVDVAYGPQSGYSMTGRAFLVTWADQNNTWQGSAWSGIWGGFVDATEINYSSTDPVPANAFPISAIADHWTTDADVESWRPRATFNPSSQKFFVVWRETPGTNPLNNTTVKHIRGSYVYEKVPATNVIISSTTGTEDPRYPAVATSTTSEKALVAWQDYRNGATSNWDIYGSIQKVADPVTPSTLLFVTNTLDAGAGSLRQAILDANARSGKDTIAFDIPGDGPHSIMPVAPLPPVTDPVWIDGYTQAGSRMNTNALHLPCNAVLKILIDGTALAGPGPLVDGLHIKGGSSCVRGVAICSFTGSGLVLEGEGGNVVEGNFIGTDAWGAIPLGNRHGIYIDNVPDNMVGGSAPAARNVLAGNTHAQVAVEHAGATGNRVLGNFIGINSAGTASLGISAGVWISEAPSNFVGGTAGGEGNVVSGFIAARGWGYGIYIAGDTATGNTVAGNLVGTNPAGDGALPNTQIGIIMGGKHNVVGGTVAAARNIISGNTQGGVAIWGGDSNAVQGNYIGTDVTGSKAVPNSGGVVVAAGNRNLVGGRAAETANVISGNYGTGLQLSYKSAETRVEGNRIGTQADGVSPLGNEEAGVAIRTGTSRNIVGGDVTEATNIIAYNGYCGVLVTDDSTGSRISRNSIYGNAWLGINLAGGVEDIMGITANDPGDADSGPNGLQNYPVLTGGEGGDYLSLDGYLNSSASSMFTLEFFATPPDNPLSYGEGQTFLGSIDVTTDASGHAPFSLTIGTPIPRGQLITATATDVFGNTSEFSAPFEIKSLPGDLVVTNTLDGGAGSLRQSILDANSKLGTDNITFNIPGSGPHFIMPASPLPDLTESVVIDGYTQPGSKPNTAEPEDSCNAALTIILSGTLMQNSQTLSDGLHIRGGTSRIRGLVINSFHGVGIVLEDHGGNVIEGNFIGTDVTGMTNQFNWGGIIVDNVPSNIIGGTTAAARNVISGNKGDGGIVIRHHGARGNYVLGNFISINAAGKAALGNMGAGILIYDAPDNIIGGTVRRMGNVISGTDWQWMGGRGYNVWIRGDSAMGNTVLGNLIGTTAIGDTVVESTGDGVSVQGHGNTIGGTGAESRNIISGNLYEGVSVYGTRNVVQGNYIGTDISGSKALGNGYCGVRVFGDSNIVGGRSPGQGNVISGNVQSGICLNGSVYTQAGGNVVEGNWIGTQADGYSPLGNIGPGVEYTFISQGNAIGNVISGAGNTIAFNGGEGVRVSEFSTSSPYPSGGCVSGNSIYANGGLGINLVGGVEDGNGVTENDQGDADTGPNSLQNFPVLSSVAGGNSLFLQGNLNSSPNSMFRLEFFATPSDNPLSYREGQTFVGWTNVTTDATGNVTFSSTIGTPVGLGRWITATATDPDGNTSEFSVPMLITVADVATSENLPTRNELMQNYPNPFNPSTTVQFALPHRAHVTIAVFNTLGQQVAMLVNDDIEAGYHAVRFEAKELASGVYFYRMQARHLDGGQAGDFVQTRKFCVLR